MNNHGIVASDASRQLDIARLKHDLATELLGVRGRLVFEPSVDSTNTLAMHLARNGSEEGIVVITDNQTAGKGRLGRRWVDMAGCNALSSTVLRPLFPPYLLVMVASLAVVAAIAETSGVEATIKWPNDVLIGERKVAGILIETAHDRAGHLIAVLGIGVNINGRSAQLADNGLRLQADITALAARATTLEEVCGHSVSRERFIATLLRQVEIRYLALQQEARDGSPQAVPAIARLLRDEWRAQLSTLGRPIQVRQGDTLLSGVAEDVNANGELLLRLHSGECISISWGDIG